MAHRLVFVALLLVACANDDADIGSSEFAQLSENQLSENQLSENALTVDPSTLAALITHPLNTSTVNGVTAIRNALHDPNARQVMKYIVSCALDGAQTVGPYVDPFDSSTATWTGSMGLCTNWNSALPTQECRERVSACLLSRVNAFGVKVHFSARGEPQAMFPVSNQPVLAFNSTAAGGTVASFASCGSMTVGLSRNCGWVPSYVGVCAPGASVQVGAGSSPTCGAPLGWSASDIMIRVCEGIRGCDAVQAMAANDDSCGTLQPAVSFTCPLSGNFAIMLAPYNSATSWNGLPDANAPVTVPATEGQVFRWREGAFYGDVFDPAALAPEAHVTVDPRSGEIRGRNFYAESTGGVVYTNMYACYSSNWNEGDAYLHKRICAGVPGGENCAAEVVGACRAPSPAVVGMPNYLCTRNDGVQVFGDYDYEICKDSSLVTAWNYPITTFLSAPCDVIGTQASCMTVTSTPLNF